MTIHAMPLDYRELNRQVKAAPGDVHIRECCGQRFIGSGLQGKTVTIHGTPGNALGSYLDGAELVVYGNAQDAVGDTMNAGTIVVHGDAGDALGYAMRGGSIFVKGNSGYRTGIHMKEYQEKKPVIVVGGRTGSFLGEYLAGGLIVVLGLNTDEIPVGNFTGTGMHGGQIFIRTEHELSGLPAQVSAEVATPEMLRDIEPYLQTFAQHFGQDVRLLLQSRYYRLSPNAKNPYKKLYTAN